MGTPLRPDDAQRVRTVISRYPGHDRAFCFVATEADQVFGFVTCAVLDHPVLFGREGEIEELGVVPHARQRSIKAALVRHVVLHLKQHDVDSIHTRVATDEPGERTFWRSLGWDNTMTIFSIYSNVPGDPRLQQVWDEYQE